MPEYPKIRIYRQHRNKITHQLSWQYLGSTTLFATPARALEGAIDFFKKTQVPFRAECAYTHGYYIED